MIAVGNVANILPLMSKRSTEVILIYEFKGYVIRLNEWLDVQTIEM